MQSDLMANALVTWKLWEGNHLALEIQHWPATHFHTVTYEGGGWPRLKTYRVFSYSPDEGRIEAQLERQPSGR